MITPAALRAAYAAGDTIRLATSGTSGRARSVVRTAASWVDSFPVAAQMWGLTARSRAWVPGPVHASMNAYAICLVDHVGARLVDDHRTATHVFVTPNRSAELLDDDLARLTMIIAGDRLSATLADRATASGIRVHHYYGAAQLSFVGWGRDADSLQLFPGVRAETRDGALWVSSPWLCLREEGADPVLQTDIRDGATWMSVGDRGSVTEDGRVVVHGRADAVTTAGVTVVLADVEAALRPRAFGELIVAGRPHPRLGAVLVALCTDPRDVDLLPSVARSELPSSHRPRMWSSIDALPVTAAGKVDRAALDRAEVGLE